MIEHSRDPLGNLVSPSVIPKMAYWLVPEKGALARLQEVVDQLAEEFNGPSFVPHLTVYWGPFDAKDQPLQLLADASKVSSPLEFSYRGLHFGELFNMSCFATYESNSDANPISEVFRRGSSVACDYEFKPHLSLYYGILTQEQREFVAESISLPEKILFDELWAISNTAQVAQASDVEAWRRVGKASLQK